ncbi:Bardet-Biedl syndrome 10 protein, partial [Acanthisitta chloris]
GELRALLVTEPLQPSLAGPGVEFAVHSEGQYRGAQRWIAGRVEAVMKRLQSSNVKLLLSSAKQGEVVTYYAKLHGISVVECLSEEEMALIGEITGVSPYTPLGDDMCGEITETAVAAFCPPLLLGSRRCVHVGLSSVCGFQPHCLILCGPVDGVNEQHAEALQGALTMLQQLFKTVEQREGCGAEVTQKVVEYTFCNSNQVSKSQLQTLKDETETKILDPDKSDALVDNQNNHSTAVLVAHNADTGTASEHLDVGEGLEETSCNTVLFEREESCVSIAQGNSSSLIEAGSVLPVGGYFEVLLHYYIHHYAKQCRQSEVAVVSSVVADALLSIPKCLYRTAEGDSFTHFYLKTINSLRKNEPLPMSKEGVESVYCKYQLVISVLYCAAELLSIDLIIDIKRPLQKIEDCDSEDEL